MYAVRNGLGSRSNLSSASAATSSGAGAPAGADNTGSSAAFRVAFVTATFANATAQSIENVLTQRVREHFTGENTFYAIPSSGLSYTESSVIARFCDEHRVNAIVIPVFTFAADAATAGNASISGVLVVSDCAGVPYYIGATNKRESRMFANRSAVREVVDMGNDVTDQLLADFESYRRSHNLAWINLLKTGIATDPSAKRDPVLVGVLKRDGQFRIAFLREEGRGAKAGLEIGDIIVNIDGARIPSDTAPFAVVQQLDEATTVLVRRPDGDKTITLAR
jgi:hypothetical protein